LQEKQKVYNTLCRYREGYQRLLDSVVSGKDSTLLYIAEDNLLLLQVDLKEGASNIQSYRRDSTSPNSHNHYRGFAKTASEGSGASAGDHSGQKVITFPLRDWNCNRFTHSATWPRIN
tara:strand:- start:3407 stop:3760 length:354 start_codon:yes stop_codon:yes gene_type:complete